MGTSIGLEKVRLAGVDAITNSIWRNGDATDRDSRSTGPLLLLETLCKTAVPKHSCVAGSTSSADTHAHYCPTFVADQLSVDGCKFRVALELNMIGLGSPPWNVSTIHAEATVRKARVSKNSFMTHFKSDPLGSLTTFLYKTSLIFALNSFDSARAVSTETPIL